MSWADSAIQSLMEGHPVIMYPRGHSMVPTVLSGQRCVVYPLADGEPVAGDVVLCKVKGRHYLHLVRAVQGGRYQIGNNKGKINGWVGRNSIYGKFCKKEK